MTDKPKITVKISPEDFYALSSPSLRAYAEPEMDCNIGSLQRYFFGEIKQANDLNRHYLEYKSLYESEIKRLTIEVDKISIDPVFCGRGNQQQYAEMAAKYDGARAAIKYNKNQLEDLKIVALPSVEMINKIVVQAQECDDRLQLIGLTKFHYENWDKLKPDIQDFYFNALSAQHKQEYERKMADYNNSFKMTSNYLPPKGAAPQMMFEDENGVKQTMTMVTKLQALPEYKPLVKNSPEFMGYLKVQSRMLQENANNLITFAQQNIDLARGVFPQGTVSSESIEKAMDDIWSGFCKRTFINGGAGIAGAALAVRATALAGKYILPAAEGAGMSWLSSVTGVTVADLALTRAAIPAFEMVLPNIATKAGGVLAGLAGGVAVEAPIDLTLSALLEKDSAGVATIGPLAPPPSMEEATEMAKKIIHKDTNLLEEISLFVGYEKPLLTNPALLIEGQKIPSRCVSSADLEAALKTTNPELAPKEVRAVIASIERYEELEAIYTAKSNNFLTIKEALKQKEPPVERKIPVMQGPLAQAEPISPTQVAATNNGDNKVANNGSNDNTIGGR